MQVLLLKTSTFIIFWPDLHHQQQLWNIFSSTVFVSFLFICVTNGQYLFHKMTLLTISIQYRQILYCCFKQVLCKKQTKNIFLSMPMRNYSCCLMKIVWCNNPLIYLDTESIWINIQLGSTFILEIMSLTLLIWFINFIIAYQWGSVIIFIRKFHLNIGRFLGNHLEKEHPIL